RADQFPQSLGGDSTGWIRRGEGISTSGSFPVLGGGSGFEISPSEAGGGFLGVCGRGLPSVRDKLPLGTQRHKIISQ
ncbi:hypothetical protein PENNAL_c0080G00154, partial [Penicillium nalgiovense]